MEGLGINLPLLVAQIINFGILVLLLYFIAYKPIIKMLDQRSAKIKDSMEQAEAIKQKTVQVEQEIKSQLEEARKESEGIITQATHIGDKLKEEAKKGALQECESLINRAKVEIERKREEAIGELRKEFVDIAIRAAEKVIKETLDKEKHRRIIEDVMEESATLKGSSNTEKRT